MRGLRTVSTLAIASAVLALTAPAHAGSPPVLQFQPSPVPAFGSVAVGQPSVRTFILTNTGGTATAALKVTLGPSAAFTIPAGGDKCTAVSLGPKKSCAVTVSYTPAAAGANDSATLTASGKKPAQPASLTLTGSSPTGSLSAAVSPNPDVVADATIGVPVARSYTATNESGAFTGRMTGTTLGSATMETPTIAHLAQQQRVVTVTSGSTSLRATIGSTSDTDADLDLFVFNCTTGSCVLAGQAQDGDSEESVTIPNPVAGTWVVLVDGSSVPAGTTTYDYIDVFTNPAFGSVSVTDANAVRPTGSSWTVPGSVTVNAAPAAGRVLVGAVELRTDANVLVGSGDVVVQNVTP
jgi:hypothetical protein